MTLARSSLKICTAEYLISDTNGIGVRKSWLPDVVAEQFLESSKDGEIKLSPDPVTMIDGDLTFFNRGKDKRRVAVQVHRAPRSIVAQSPSTVVIHDAWSYQVGESPTADYPSIVADTFGGRMQIDRSSVARDKVQFCRFFLEGDDSIVWQDIGIMEPGDSLHFRYLAAVQTPGVWTNPSEFEPRWEANAYWARLRAWAGPVGV